MKAVVWTKYGSPDVLKLQEIAKPTLDAESVLIKVHAATVTAGDCEFRNLKFPFWLALPIRLYVGLRKPKRMRVLGQELSGEVEAVGANVKAFKPGDAVFGTTGVQMGAYAEYICLKAEGDEEALALKPPSMSYEEAAAVPTGGLEALNFLRKVNLQQGDRILINGAGGSIGTFAVQLAKHFGAEVTGVDSAEKLDMIRSIGADDVVDYKKEDFSKRGRKYDVVFDMVVKGTFSRSIRALNANGRYIMANPRLSSLFRGMVISLFGGKKIMLGTAVQQSENLDYLRELIEAGHLHTVIDRQFPLEQTAEAHHYVETGRKQGHVIIKVANS